MASLTTTSIAALFNALAVHVYTICTSGAVDRSLAETRATVCMLALSAMKRSWPVSGWVLKLFEMIMHRLKQSTHAKKPKPRRESRPPAIRVRSTHLSSGIHSRAEPRHSAALLQMDSDDQAGRKGGHEQSAGTWYSDPLEHGLRNEYQTPSMSDLGYDVPNMFTFDGNITDAALDQDNFFQWLDVPSFNDFSQGY